MWKKLCVLFVLLLVLSFSVFALAPLKATEKETAVTQTSKKAETTTTEKSSDLSEISDKINSLLFVSSDTKAELNDRVDSIKKDLDDALALNKKTRFFVNFGVALGLKEKVLQYGATADIGLKFGCGLMMKMGAVYMIGSDFKNIQWGLEGLTTTATIGWEW